MLFGMTAADETRRLTRVGVALVLCLVVTGLVAVIKPFGGGATNGISVVVDSPYVGQGVATGTAIVLHGVEVGKVTAVSSLPGGGVRLRAILQGGPAAGLTDSLGIDFRPANYFGVTGINIIPNPGGHPLREGARITTVPKGSFTLESLISRLGEISGGVITPRLVEVIDRATRYTDALDPLIETMLIAANAVTTVQTVSTERLLRNTTGVSVAFPSFVDSLTGSLHDILLVDQLDVDQAERAGPGATEAGRRVAEDYWHNGVLATLELLSKAFFAAVGRLESSHVDDLTPAVALMKTLADVVPGLITPDGVSATLVELRTRFERLYAGSPDQRALQVRIVLDNLPGVAAPVAAMGGP